MINALPSSLNSLVEKIDAAIKSWPVHVSLEHAIRWVLQFEAEDYGLAVRILEHIDVLGTSEIRAALEIAHTKLLRKISEKGTPLKGDNTLFAAIGSSAKSGSLIAYHYRVTADIAEDNFVSSDEEDNLNLTKIDNIVLVDDVIGSGRTIAKEVKRVGEEVYSLSRSRNIFVLTVAGYSDGIKHVLDETGATVVTALEYNTNDTVANLDGVFYSGMPVSERNVALEKIKRYCRNISTSSLGYTDLGGLLVFDHNTPNTTLPIIWSSSKGWQPLFPRAGKIVGAAKILKSAADERAKSAGAKPSQKNPNIRHTAEVTLFVEGKVDEIFVDYLSKRQSLSARLGVGNINSIALGGLYQSPRLLELLRDSRKYAIFVLDNDKHAVRAAVRLSNLEGVQVMHLNPTFMGLLDIAKIYSQRDRFPGLPDQIGEINNEIWLHEVEMATLKRGPVYANSDRITQIIDEFIDLEKYEKFSSQLKIHVDKIFEEIEPLEKKSK